MAKKTKRERFKIPNAKLLYEPWSFRHYFTRRRVNSVERFTIRSIGVDGVEFITPIPPLVGQKVLVNIRLPDEPEPLILRGEVKGVKPFREELKEQRVWIKFTHAPKDLAETLRNIGEMIV